MRKTISFRKVAITFTIVFLLFILWTEWRTQISAQKSLEQHANVISSALWNLDAESPMEYLKLVCIHDSYEMLRLKDLTGHTFIEIDGQNHNKIMRFLINIGLTQSVSLSTPVYYHNKKIGNLEVIWHNLTIFTYLYTLIVGILLVAVIHLYFRIIGINRTLELRVEERTASLRCANEALGESEKKYRNLFEESNDGIVLILDDFTIIDVNLRLLEMLGYKKTNMLNQSPALFQPEEEIAKTKKVKEQVDRHGFAQFETRMLKANGDILDVDIHAGIIDNENHVIQAIVRDITEKKLDEAEKLRLRNLLRNIIDSMPSVLVGVDTNGIVTQWNREAQRMSNKSPKEACGKHVENLIPQMGTVMSKVRLAIHNCEVQTSQKVPSKQNGAIVYSDITVYPLVSNGVEGAVIRIDDVTERMQMEEMIIQSEKMLSIGGLAAGMAHEINNPLAGILQNMQVLRNRLTMPIPKNQEAAENCGFNLQALKNYMEQRDLNTMIEMIEQSARRAAHIVENMLNFSRKSASQHLPQNIHLILDKTLELASSDYNLKKQYDFKKIEIIREYDPNLPPVPCDITKVQQVFLNVIKNAAESMSEAATPDKMMRLTLRTSSNNGMAHIEIEDNGPGMDEATCKRVFEPFFTTKDVGVGTGLGLSVSYFIITENHSGEMTAESSPGKGTCFTIALPLKVKK